MPDDTTVENALQSGLLTVIITHRVAIVPLDDGRWAACGGDEHAVDAGWYERRIYADWEPEGSTDWSIGATLPEAVTAAVARAMCEKESNG